MPVERAIRLLNQLKGRARPLPDQVRVNIGPEPMTAKLAVWSDRNGVYLHHIQKGALTQNVCIERFQQGLS